MLLCTSLLLFGTTPGLGLSLLGQQHQQLFAPASLPQGIVDSAHFRVLQTTNVSFMTRNFTNHLTTSACPGVTRIIGYENDERKREREREREKERESPYDEEILHKIKLIETKTSLRWGNFHTFASHSILTAFSHCFHLP